MIIKEMATTSTQRTKGTWEEEVGDSAT